MPGSRRAHLLPSIGVLVLGLLAYANVLPGDFVFDDLRQIRDNAVIHDLGSFLARSEGYRFNPNRFVGYLTFALNYRYGGLRTTGYHAVNVGIHLANALLVYSLAVLALRSPRLRTSALGGSPRAVGFAAAALFVTHPLQTQAVSYIVQRLTSLAALFYLLAAVLYLTWRLGEGQAPGLARRRALPYLGAVASAILAVRTKEIAFTLPFALLLAERLFFGRLERRRWVALAPFAAAALLIPLTLVSLAKPVGEVLSDVSRATQVQTALPRLDYLRTEVVVIAAYLRLLAWPADQNVDHDVPVFRSSASPEVLWSLALLLALAGLAAWLAWRCSVRRGSAAIDPAARLIAFGIAWFFLALAVESSLIPIVDVMFEHRAYLPSAGIFIAASAAVALALRRIAGAVPARALAAGAVALSLLLAFGTLLRNRAWWSELALWSDAAAKAPGKARVQFNLGTALSDLGRTEEAVGPLRLAVQADPSWANARTQLGGILLLLGRAVDAEPELREALRLAPDEMQATYNLAEVLWRTGRREQALPLLRRYLELAPPSQAQLREIAAGRLRRGP